jgi:catechol 2,3-dioxygenase-like lactoylglutathione lyase family enzyme
MGIESVTYGVDDVAKSASFFEDFGLMRLEGGATGASFATPEETTILVRRADDPTLPRAVEPGPTVREIVWGVDTSESLEAIAANLSADQPITRSADGVIHAVDPAGFGIAFSLTRRRPVRLEPQTLNTIGECLRRNERVRFYDRARPQHLGHIVLYSPNYQEQFAFYVDRLGFMVSDTLRTAGAFLRCSTDHHNLFLLRAPRAGMNHLSFGVQNLDEIWGGFKVLTKQGWTPSWGPGRHYIGSNLFYYFRNPSGGHVEYYADMDCITDPALWTPGDFDPSAPEARFAWGQAPPPDFSKSQYELEKETIAANIA